MPTTCNRIAMSYFLCMATGTSFSARNLRCLRLPFFLDWFRLLCIISKSFLKSSYLKGSVVQVRKLFWRFKYRPFAVPIRCFDFPQVLPPILPPFCLPFLPPIFPPFDLSRKIHLQHNPLVDRGPLWNDSPCLQRRQRKCLASGIAKSRTQHHRILDLSTT